MTPAETKVKASTATAAASGLALWLLGRYVFKTGVPDVVASWVYVLIPALLTFAAGYLAPHTPRTLTVPPASAGDLEQLNATLKRAGYVPSGNVVVTDEAAGTSHVFGPVAPQDPPAGKAT